MFMSEDLKTAHPKYEDSVNICFYVLGAPTVYPEQLRFVSPSVYTDIRLIWWDGGSYHFGLMLRAVRVLGWLS